MLPKSFSENIEKTEIVTTYDEFLQRTIKIEVEERFNNISNQLKNDIKKLDKMIFSFVSEINSYPEIPKRQNLVKTKIKNPLTKLKPNRKDVLHKEISSCLEDISNTAHQIKKTQINFLKDVLKHPNELIRNSMGIKGNEEIVSNILGTVAKKEVLDNLKKTTLSAELFTFSLPKLPDPKNILDSVGQKTESLSNYTSKIPSLEFSSFDKNLIQDNLNSFSNNVENALKDMDVVEPRKILSGVSSFLTDIMPSFQEGKNGAIKSTSESFNSLKSLPDHVLKVVNNLKSEFEKTSKLMSDIISDKTSLKEIKKIVEKTDSEIQEKLSNLISVSQGLTKNLSAFTQGTFDSKVDFSNLPIPSIKDMVEVLKKELNEVNKKSGMTSEERKIFAMIMEIESFMKTKQIYKRMETVKKMRNCIKSQIKNAKLNDISFLNNLPVTQQDTLDYNKLIFYVKNVDKNKIKAIEIQSKQYKKEINEKTPKDKGLKMILNLII